MCSSTAISVSGGVTGSNNVLINGNNGQITNNFYYVQIGENRSDLEHLIKLIMNLTQQEETEEELGMMVNDVLNIANQHVEEEQQYEYETEPISSTSETATSITKPSITPENELYETKMVIETTQLPKLSTTIQNTEMESTRITTTTKTTTKTTTTK